MAHDIGEAHVLSCVLGNRLLCYLSRREWLAKRLGHEVAEQLLATMSTSSRIASLVKELRLAIRDVQRTEASECTWTSLRVLQLCPNVTHVEIRGFHHSQSDALAEALKAKSESLISLFITPHSLSTSNHHGSSFRILYVMHRLPKLRITNADGLSPFVERNAADADAPSCCPDLQEIQIVNCDLHYNDLTSIRRMMCEKSRHCYETLIRQRSSAKRIVRLPACVVSDSQAP